MKGWIAALPVGALALACGQGSAGGEDVGSAGSGVAIEGPWRLPANVRAAGAQASVTYDDAPRWTGTNACTGGLTSGARRLGAMLRSRFGGISSVGGYACRRNTGNGSRMSVHGTGRALDLMIPRVGDAADNSAGDPIANWLVVNADRIGIQLIIWDRTVWHADGRNESRYTGQFAHDDHIHVEVNLAAAAMQTPFFKDADAGSMDLDEGTTAPQPPEEEEEDEPATGSGGTKTPAPAPTPTSTGSAPAPAPTPAPTTSASSAPAPSATTNPEAIEPEANDDGPGETDSLKDGVTPMRYEAPYMPASSCAVATTPGTAPGGTFVTIALGALAMIGARRRTRR